jgi:multiple sugar transport system substrate-binding protein
MSAKRKLTRRQFVLTAAAVAGSVALSACSGRTPTTVAPPGAPAASEAPKVAGKVTLQWIEWITPEISEEKMQGVLGAFYKTEAGKNIQIERLSMPNAQVHDKVVTLNLADQVPDVLNMSAQWVVEFAEQGILAPLNPFLEKAGKEWVGNLVQGPMQPWKGQTYLVPLTSIPFLLYYNERKLEAAGFSAPPKTWDEVAAMGPKLTDPSKNTYCYASGMAAQSPFNGSLIEQFPLIYQGNDTVMKDGKCNLTSPAAVAGFKYYLHLLNDLKIYAPGALTNLEKDKLEAFGAEQTALLWSNVAHVIVIEQRNPNLKFGLAPLPKGVTHGTVLTGWNSSISRKGKNQDAAWEFISWLAGPEGNAKMTIAAKHLPGNTKADVSEMFAADPRLKVPVDILAGGRVFMETAAMPQVTDLMRIHLEQVAEAASGKKTPEQALEATKSGWDEILAKYA